jgi:hypothetical protein
MKKTHSVRWLTVICLLAAAAELPGQVRPLHTRDFTRLGLAGSLSLGSWHADVMDHDGSRGRVLPATAAEREVWGREGAEQVRAIVKAMRMVRWSLQK